MRHSHTSAIELGTTWEGAFATEPQECAWATEALFFIRVLEGGVAARGGSPGGDQPGRYPLVPRGHVATVSPPSRRQQAWARVREFGGWLRLTGSLPRGTNLQVLVHLVLKE